MFEDVLRSALGDSTERNITMTVSLVEDGRVNLRLHLKEDTEDDLWRVSRNTLVPKTEPKEPTEAADDA